MPKKKPDKNESETQCSYRIPGVLQKKLKVYCAVTSTSQNAFVNDAVEQRLQKVVEPGFLKELLDKI